MLKFWSVPSCSWHPSMILQSRFLYKKFELVICFQLFRFSSSWSSIHPSMILQSANFFALCPPTAWFAAFYYFSPGPHGSHSKWFSPILVDFFSALWCPAFYHFTFFLLFITFFPVPPGSQGSCRPGLERTPDSDDRKAISAGAKCVCFFSDLFFLPNLTHLEKFRFSKLDE